jgi:hypothetical protein
VNSLESKPKSRGSQTLLQLSSGRGESYNKLVRAAVHRRHEDDSCCVLVTLAKKVRRCGEVESTGRGRYGRRIADG